MKNITLFTFLLFIGFTINLISQGNAVISAANANILATAQLVQNSTLSFEPNLLTTKLGETSLLHADNITRIYPDDSVSLAVIHTNENYTVTVTGLALTKTNSTYKSISSGANTVNNTLMEARFNDAVIRVEAKLRFIS